MKTSVLIVSGVLAVSACAAPPPPPRLPSAPSPPRPPTAARPEPPPPSGRWQCAPYARARSGVQLRGEAWTWWAQAENRYQRGPTPKSGAVLVFQPFRGTRLGHVAVIDQVLTDRIVLVDHANWGGSRGRIEQGVAMVDVSPAGNWSQVKVWYAPGGNLGGTVYPTYGFIYPDPVRSAATGAEPHAESRPVERSGAGGRRSDR